MKTYKERIKYNPDVMKMRKRIKNKDTKNGIFKELIDMEIKEVLKNFNKK